MKASSFYFLVLIVTIGCSQKKGFNEKKIMTNKNILSNLSEREINPEDFEQIDENILDTSNSQKHQYYNCSRVDCATLVYYLDKYYLSIPTEKNILYYYKRLFPFFIFSDDFAGFKNLLNRKILPGFYEDKIIYKNVLNGYLEFYGYPSEGNEYKNSIHKRQMALFRSPTGEVFILINEVQFKAVYAMVFDEKNFTWHNTFTYLHPNHGYERVSYIEKLFSSINIENLYFKLPEYGTTILACEDDRDFIENPEAFWEDKLKNAPDEIIRLNWQDGKFVIEAPESKSNAGGGGMPTAIPDDKEVIPNPTFLSPSGSIFAQATPIHYRFPLYTKPPGNWTWELNTPLSALPPNGAAQASLHFNYEDFDVQSDFFDVSISPTENSDYKLTLHQTIIFKLIHPLEGNPWKTFQLPKGLYFFTKEEMYKPDL